MGQLQVYPFLGMEHLKDNRALPRVRNNKKRWVRKSGSPLLSNQMGMRDRECGLDLHTRSHCAIHSQWLQVNGRLTYLGVFEKIVGHLENQVDGE